MGVCLGGTWTSARPLLVRLVPEEELAEFFGLYAMSGKVAAIFGPLIWGGVLWAGAAWPAGVRYRVAVAVLAGLLALGLVILRWMVPEGQKRI